MLPGNPVLQILNRYSETQRYVYFLKHSDNEIKVSLSPGNREIDGELPHIYIKYTLK